MNKTDMVKYLSDKTMITRDDSNIILDVILDGIKKALVSGDKVVFQNFGSLFLQERKARKAYSPINQEEIDVPAKTVVKFKMSKELRENLN